MKRCLCLLLMALLLLGLRPAAAAATEPRCGGVPEYTMPEPVVVSAWEAVRALPEAPGETYKTVSDAAEALRRQLKQRHTQVTLTLESSQEWAAVSSLALLDIAFAHTGVPTEGDYLRDQAQCRDIRISLSSADGRYYQTISYTFTYYSTAAQEQMLDAAVSELLSQLDLAGKTDYEKVRTIYDWITANITYDHVNLEDDSYTLKYSAYAALIDRTAVCNGYSLLFYRLLLEAGVENRKIGGETTPGHHAWNLVLLGDRYYYCDPTWDAGRSSYLYFLRSRENFDDHVDKEEFSTPGFRAAYPVGVENYIPGADSGVSGTHWSYADGVLTIFGIGRLPDCTPDTQPWKDYRSDIRRIVVKKGVTSIGASAFFGCTALTEIALPDGLTRIGTGAFSGCTVLKEIRVPGSVGILEDMAFLGCRGLQRVTLNTGLYQLGHFVFDGCSSLQSLTLPQTVTQLGDYVFRDCTALKAVVLPDRLPSIPMGTFCGCTRLSGVDIPDAVETMGSYGFYGCAALRSVVIPEGVTKIPDLAFYGCTALSRAVLPASLKEIAGFAFHGCESLSGIAIPKSVTAIGNSAFFGCAKLKAVCLPEGITELPNQVFANCAQLKDVTILGPVTRIGNSAFLQCGALTALTLPETVTELGSSVLQRCTALKTITLPAGVTRIPDLAFAACENLTKVTILGSVTRIGVSAFHGCKNLPQIQLPHGLESIGEKAFCGCASLRELEVPDSVTRMENHIFWGCTVLKTVSFTGNAPAVSPECFLYATTTVFYPSDNATWEQTVKNNYGGTITWKPYKPVCAHSGTRLVNAREASCVASGYTGDTVCILCGEMREKGKTVPALGHSWDGGVVTREPTVDAPGQTVYTCTRCGETMTVEADVTRICGDNRFETAFAVADAMKRNLGIEKFDAVIVASGTNFPDALSGSYLATVKNAPILLSFNEAYNRKTMAYIRENLIPGGTVYLLGSRDVVPDAFRFGLTDCHVIRLGGSNRFETNLEILKEAGVGGKDVLVCTGTGFADSLSASAVGLPILLVYENLYDVQREFLAEYCSDSRFWIIGSESAVSDHMLSQISQYGMVRRIGGANRFETSVKLAGTFYDAPEYTVLAYAWNYPDGLCGGPLAAALDAPLILTMTGCEDAAADYIQGARIKKGLVLGGKALISDDSVRDTFG